MEVTYIKHSGFLAEWDDCAWIFDYYQGEVPDISKEKKILVFSSHEHEDHFNPAVFDLFYDYPNVEYILSSDIEHLVKKLSLEQRQQEQITYLKPHEECVVDDGKGVKIRIQTLTSTDCGVAFLVTYGLEEEKVIYHAGDLNCWVWKGETKQEYEDMTAKYRGELMALRELTDSIDVAFVPLDPRQEEWYRLGMDYFMELVGADLVFPIHFWEDFPLIEQYKASPEARAYADRIASITGPGMKRII